MTVNFESDVEYEFDFPVESDIIRTVEACLDYVSCPYEAEVNVLLTNNDIIHELNKESRGIDRPTDVLSFPLIDYDTPAVFDFSEDEEIELCNPDSGELLLGDIVISLDKVEEQSKEFGHSKKRELLFLVCHSMFHLFGYDHENDEERENMERMQREVLDALGIER